MKKLLGYLAAGVGIIALVLTVKPVQELITLPEIVTNLYLYIGGGILLLLGLAILSGTGGGSKQAPEVPIYKGKNIVGYRRH